MSKRAIILCMVASLAVAALGVIAFRNRHHAQEPDPLPREKFQEVQRVKGEDLALSFTNEIRARVDSNGVDVLDFITSIPGTSMVATIVAPSNLLYLSPFNGFRFTHDRNRGFTSRWWNGFAAAPTNAVKQTNTP